MTSDTPGMPILAAEVTNVSAHGFWLLLGAQELFVPFAEFPWFRDASIAQITTVERPSQDHLRWPALDIDLAVGSLLHPDDYPLISRMGGRAANGEQRT